MLRNLQGNATIAAAYSSASQKARVVTEGWIEANGYCLACESDNLIPTRRNTRARDFECQQCSHPYELKSTAGRFGKRIVDGAYATMMKRVQESTTPTLLLLEYSPSWEVRNLSAIHHSLITPLAIERRKPLSATAKRSGWIGCNISLSSIPPEGQIQVVTAGCFLSPLQCRIKFASVEKIAAIPTAERTWTSNMLLLLHGLGKRDFTIKDAYSLEDDLSKRYPSNHHIREKIRQQLQLLRNSGLLTFKSRGHYHLTMK